MTIKVSRNRTINTCLLIHICVLKYIILLKGWRLQNFLFVLMNVANANLLFLSFWIVVKFDANKILSSTIPMFSKLDSSSRFLPLSSRHFLPTPACSTRNYSFTSPYYFKFVMYLLLLLVCIKYLILEINTLKRHVL